MASQTYRLPVPFVLDQANISWSFPADAPLVDAGLVEGTTSARPELLTMQNRRWLFLRLTDPGPDLTTAWGRSSNAVTLTAGGESQTLAGPDAIGSVVSDSTEPYFWRPRGGNRRMREVIDWFRRKSTAERAAATLTLSDTGAPAKPVIGAWRHAIAKIELQGGDIWAWSGRGDLVFDARTITTPKIMGVSGLGSALTGDGASQMTLRVATEGHESTFSVPPGPARVTLWIIESSDGGGTWVRLFGDRPARVGRVATARVIDGVWECAIQTSPPTPLEPWSQATRPQGDDAFAHFGGLDIDAIWPRY